MANRKHILSLVICLLFIFKLVDAQLSQSFRIPDNNEGCNVVNLNFAGDGKQQEEKVKLQQGLPGKRGPMGPVGPPGKTGKEGPKGDKGENGMNMNEIKKEIMKLLSATTCKELLEDHGISSSGHYLLRRENSTVPEYVYCDFELRDGVSSCLDLGEKIESPKAGYYLMKSNITTQPIFVHCSIFEKNLILPKSCEEVVNENAKIKKPSGGVFDIYPKSREEALEVYCDTKTDGGGWTVFQRRENGKENFYRNWIDYVNGFGEKDKEMWLGLETIYQLTKDNENELRVDLTDWSGNSVYAKYGSFSISSGSDKYKITVDDYSGTAGDSLTYHNGEKFTTKDADNDSWGKNCASGFNQGAWWYKACSQVNLNGVYYQQEIYSENYHGVFWYHWKNSRHRSLKFTEMKFRKKRA